MDAILGSIRELIEGDMTNVTNQLTKSNELYMLVMQTANRANEEKPGTGMLTAIETIAELKKKHEGNPHILKVLDGIAKQLPEIVEENKKKVQTQVEAAAKRRQQQSLIAREEVPTNSDLPKIDAVDPTSLLELNIPDNFAGGGNGTGLQTDKPPVEGASKEIGAILGKKIPETSSVTPTHEIIVEETSKGPPLIEESEKIGQILSKPLLTTTNNKKISDVPLDEEDNFMLGESFVIEAASYDDIDKELVSKNLESWVSFWERSHALHAFNEIERIRSEYPQFIFETDLDKEYHLYLKKIENKEMSVFSDKYVEIKEKISKVVKYGKTPNTEQSKQIEKLTTELNKFVKEHKFKANISEIHSYHKKFKEIEKENEVFEQTKERFEAKVDLIDNGYTSQKISFYKKFLEDYKDKITDGDRQKYQKEIEKLQGAVIKEQAVNNNKFGRFKNTLKIVPESSEHNNHRQEAEKLDKLEYENDGLLPTQRDGKLFDEFYTNVKAKKINESNYIQLKKCYLIAQEYNYQEFEDVKEEAKNQINIFYKQIVESEDAKTIIDNSLAYIDLSIALKQRLENPNILRKKLTEAINSLMEADFANKAEALYQQIELLKKSLLIIALVNDQNILSIKISKVKNKLKPVIETLFRLAAADQSEEKKKYLLTVIKLIDLLKTSQTDHKEIYQEALKLHAPLLGNEELSEGIQITEDEVLGEGIQISGDDDQSPKLKELTEALDALIRNKSPEDQQKIAKQMLSEVEKEQDSQEKIEFLKHFISSIGQEAQRMKQVQELRDQGKYEEAEQLINQALEGSTN